MTEQCQPLLCLDGVTLGFPERPRFLQPVSLRVERGHFWGIIGPNGAGKSTLLRIMAGLARPDSGEICMEGQPLGSIPARDRARRIAFLPQSPPRDVAMPASQVVLMGRYPHRQLGLFESVQDHEIARKSMETTQTSVYADRVMNTLSGGEAQRVHLAAALAQEPRLLLLDEPTASLDLYHQLEIFSMLRALVESKGLTIVLVTHDLNLAARFCSHVLLLNDGRPIASGTPREVITPQLLEPVYGVRLSWIRGEDAEGWLIPVQTIGSQSPRAGGR